MKWTTIWAAVFFAILAGYGLAPDSWRDAHYETLVQVHAAILASCGYAAVPFTRAVDKTTLAVLMSYCWGLAMVDWWLPSFSGGAAVATAIVFATWMLHARRVTGHWLGVESARDGIRRAADVFRRAGG